MSERPTFAEAFTSEGTGVESLATETPTETTSPVGAATATESPVGQTAPSETTTGDGLTGSIPTARHKEILDGAYKERDTFKQELESLSWAKQIDRATVEQGHSLGRLFQQDRPGFIRQVLAEAASDPDLAPLVRSEAARVLGARSQPAPPAPIEPGIPVMNERGEIVARTYTDDQIRTLVTQQVADLVGKEVSPLKQDFQTRQARDQAERESRQLESAIAETYQDAVDLLPGFKEHEAEISNVFATLHGKDPAKDLRAAWHQVVGRTLANADKVKAQTLDDMKTKAHASIANPAAAAVASTQRPKSLTDPSLQW